ncbi:MAG TPA: acyl carrier protein [Puia sp.]|nr:acyl carrier protein [Puia sp.]
MNTLVDKSQIVAKVKLTFHEKLGVEESALTPNASFSNDLGLDSLDVLETFMALEKEFGIRISDEELEKLTSVGAVIDYIVAHAH